MHEYYYIRYHFVRRSDCTYIIYHGPVSYRVSQKRRPPQIKNVSDQLSFDKEGKIIKISTFSILEIEIFYGKPCRLTLGLAEMQMVRKIHIEVVQTELVQNTF